MPLRRPDHIEVRELAPEPFSLLSRLCGGEMLESALAAIEGDAVGALSQLGAWNLITGFKLGEHHEF